MSSTADFLELLRRDGVVRSADARLTPLKGGVSCEIYLVEDGGERFVVKRALAKLRVEADWFADISRNRHEWEFIRYVARFRPDVVPVLRYCSETDHYFAMEYLEGFSNWKQTLLSGQSNPMEAIWAGQLLARIHQQSAADAEVGRVFDAAEIFFQIRIEPYLLTTGAKHPKLRALFETEAERLGATHECLVHGDFSPKNILIRGDRMVLLDCEVACHGDPSFDVAFLLTHFFLKGLLPAADAPATATLAWKSLHWNWASRVSCARAMKSMAGQFWSTYQKERSGIELEERVARLLLMLMLARVDGKSPVEYLDAAQQERVRAFVHQQLSDRNFSLSTLQDLWFDQAFHPSK